VIGAGGVPQQEGRTSTDQNTLNLNKESDWKNLFEENSIDALLAEHVWDYLTVEESLEALKRCYRYLKRGGYLRLSVADAYSPDKDYTAYVGDIAK
jgi:predicted SAM-dependent methyltransferase